jgi:hypothetical protein
VLHLCKPVSLPSMISTSSAARSRLKFCSTARVFVARQLTLASSNSCCALAFFSANLNSPGLARPPVNSLTVCCAEREEEEDREFTRQSLISLNQSIEALEQKKFGINIKAASLVPPLELLALARRLEKRNRAHTTNNNHEHKH